MYKKLLFLSIFLSFLGFTAKAQEEVILFENLSLVMPKDAKNDKSAGYRMFFNQNLQEGDELIIKGELIDGEKKYSFTFEEDNGYVFENYKEKQFENGVATLKIERTKIESTGEVDASWLINEIKTRGLIIYGEGLKITTISLKTTATNVATGGKIYKVGDGSLVAGGDGTTNPDPDQPDQPGDKTYSGYIQDNINQALAGLDSGKDFTLVFNYKNFVEGDKIILNFSGNGGLQVRENNSDKTTVVDQFNGINGPQITITLSSNQANSLNQNGWLIKGSENLILSSIQYESKKAEVEEGITLTPPTSTNPGDETTYKTLLFDNLSLNLDWNTNKGKFKIYFNHQFENGDKLIFEGTDKGGAQYKLAINSNGWFEITGTESPKNGSFEYTLQKHRGDNGQERDAADEINASKDNGGGLRMQGQNFTVNKIYVVCKHETIADSELGGLILNDDNEQVYPVVGGGDNDETKEVSLIDDINIYYQNWDATPYYVFFKDIQVGGKINIYVHGHQVQLMYVDNSKHSVEVNGSKFVDGVEYKTFDNWYETDPPSNYEVYVTENNIAALLNGGLCINGDNFTLRKITYTYSGEEQHPTASTEPFDDSDAEPDSEDYIEARKVSLIGRIQELSYINKNWGDVTVEYADGVATATTTKGEGFGVMSLGLADSYEKGEELDNTLYNGTPEELAQYEENAKHPSEHKDAFLDFNRFERVIITLEKQVKGARVVIYYRDLDWDNYNDEDVEEYPEYFNFPNNTLTFKVDLTPYRYIRAIALRVPEAGEYKVKDFFLYEREEYAEQKEKDILPREIWVAKDENNNLLYEGVDMGTKRFYGPDDEWRCDAGETLAWSNDIVIPGTDIASVTKPNPDAPIQKDTRILYHCFSLVYTNAHRVDPYEGHPADPAQAQLQIYINFPCYQTNQMSVAEKEYWENTKWYETENGVEPSNEYMISPINEDNKDVAKGDKSLAIYTPNVRDSHTFKTVDVKHSAEYDGSSYLEVPDDKHDMYTHALFYVKVNEDIKYPVAKTGDVKTMGTVVTNDNADTTTGNVTEALENYGIGIRGQNAKIVKFVYNGDLREYVDDDFLTPEEQEEADKFVTTGIEEVVADYTVEEPAVVNVYNLQGMTVRHGVARENALDGLASGIYIVNGKKVWVK